MKIIEGFRLREVMGQATVIGEGIGQVNFNKLITLNTTAAYLWRQVEGKDFSIEDLAELLTAHYEVDSAIAQRDASVIVNEWIKNKIVQE